MRVRGDNRPTGTFWHKEHVLGQILVLIFGIGIRVLGDLCILGFKTIGDILEEDESEDNPLVFRCVQVTAQHVRCFPDFVFKSDGDCVFCHGISLFLNFQTEIVGSEGNGVEGK